MPGTGNRTARSKTRAERPGGQALKWNEVTVLLEAAKEAIFALNADGAIKWANGAAVEVFGYTREELSGQHLHRVIPHVFTDDDREHHHNAQGLEGQSKSGVRFPVAIRLNYIHTPQGRLGLAFITEIEGEQNASPDMDDYVRVAVESDQFGTWDFDCVTGQMICSPTTKRHFGLPEVEIGTQALLPAFQCNAGQWVERIITAASEPGGEGRFATEFRRIETEDGKPRWLSIWGRVAFDKKNRPRRVTGVTLDVTSAKLAEQTVLQRKKELRSLLDNTPDSIVRLDRDMRYLYVNAAIERASGMERDAFIGKTFQEAGMPEDLGVLWSTIAGQVFASGKPAEIEFSYPSPTGTSYWEGRNFPEFADDGRVQSVLAIMRDITDKKLLEQKDHAAAEEIRALANRLMSAQEEERRRISRELHDNFLQQMALLGMELTAIGDDQAASQAIKDRLRAIEIRVAKMEQEIRHFAYELHPSIVDDLGLVASLRALCEEFSEQYGRKVKFRHRYTPGSVRLAVASNLYRITQESLRNIAKHAQAKHVVVGLATKGKRICLSIKDDGIGFDFESIKGKGGLGLISLQERARLMNGRLSIQSKPGRGARVTLDLPYSGEQTKQRQPKAQSGKEQPDDGSGT